MENYTLKISWYSCDSDIYFLGLNISHFTFASKKRKKKFFISFFFMSTITTVINKYNANVNVCTQKWLPTTTTYKREHFGRISRVTTKTTVKHFWRSTKIATWPHSLINWKRIIRNNTKQQKKKRTTVIVW